MILLVLFRSLKDLCFLLVAFPALCPKLSRCERVLLEENIMLHIDVSSAATEKTNQRHELSQAQTAYGGGDIPMYPPTPASPDINQSPRRQISPPSSSSPAAPK